MLTQEVMRMGPDPALEQTRNGLLPPGLISFRPSGITPFRAAWLQFAGMPASAA